MDNTQQLLAEVQDAVSGATTLDIVGGNSKGFLGRPTGERKINTGTHSGIVSYEPTELVVTVRAGTPLAELNAVLREHGQMLPFEPPELDKGTIGGVLACGLSGPRRPFAGSARDYVLGVREINGQAQALRFGGEVMKNVAGYDAARLHIGAFGTLGVLLEASMKVLPLPECELTIVHEIDTAQDVSMLNNWMRKPYPMSAATIEGRTQKVRLSGSESAVRAAAKTLGGEPLDEADAYWQGVRDLSAPFFSDPRCLWRLSVPEYTQPLFIDGDCLIDWAGAQRWYKTEEPPQRVFNAAAAAEGHASSFSAQQVNPADNVFQPLSGVMQRLQARVRASFDPDLLFNPGRFHPELEQR